MTRYPQVLLNFAVDEKRPLEELPDGAEASIAKVESELGDGRARRRPLLGHRGEGARDDRRAPTSRQSSAYADEIARAALKQALAG